MADLLSARRLSAPVTVPVIMRRLASKTVSKFRSRLRRLIIPLPSIVAGRMMILVG